MNILSLIYSQIPAHLPTLRVLFVAGELLYLDSLQFKRRGRSRRTRSNSRGTLRKPTDLSLGAARRGEGYQEDTEHPEQWIGTRDNDACYIQLSKRTLRIKRQDIHPNHAPYALAMLQNVTKTKTTPGRRLSSRDVQHRHRGPASPGPPRPESPSRRRRRPAQPCSPR